MSAPPLLRVVATRRVVNVVCLVLVLVIAARLRLSLPGTPFVDADSWGYAGPAVQGAIEGGLPQIYGRGFLYPAFLGLVLRIFGDFAAIAVVQHTIGLVGICCFFAAWQGTRRWLPDSRRLELAHDVLGVLALACYAFGTQLVYYEHCLRPEALFSAAACVMLWLTVATLTRPVHGRGFLLVSAAQAVWLVVLFMLHPSFAFALAGGLLPPLVRVWLTTRDWLRRLLPLAVLPAALLVANVAQDFVFSSRDVTGKVFGAMTVFSFNARNTILAIDRDLEHPEAAPYPAALLRRCADLIHAEFDGAAREGRHLLTLDYYPDRLIYDRDGACDSTRHFLKQDGERIRGFFLHYALHGILLDPGRFLAKVGRGMALAFGVRFGLLAGLYCPIDVDHELEATRQLIQNWPKGRGYAPVVAVLAELAKNPTAPQSRAVPAAARVVRALTPWFGLQVLATWLLTAGLLLRHRRRGLGGPGLSLRTHAAAVSGLCLFHVAITLTLAVVSCVDIRRYSDNQGAFTLFACFSMWTVTLHALACGWSRLRARSRALPV